MWVFPKKICAASSFDPPASESGAKDVARDGTGDAARAKGSLKEGARSGLLIEGQDLGGTSWPVPEARELQSEGCHLGEGCRFGGAHPHAARWHVEGLP